MKACLTVAICMACGCAMANFYGVDDFNDNSMDGAKWSVSQGGVTGDFVEKNSRLEYDYGTSGSTAVWAWEGNSGSYTEDWSISIDQYNGLDESTFGDDAQSEVYFGLQLASEADSNDKFSLGRNRVKSVDEGNTTLSHWISTSAKVNNVGQLEERTEITSDLITLRIDFDSQTKVLSSYYDVGAGFVAQTNFNVGSWGMADTDEFSLMVYSGTGGTVSPVNSGDVYADNFVAIPEPSVIALLGLFGGGMAVSRRMLRR